MPHSPYFDALHAICQPVRASDYPRSLAPVRQLLAALGDPQKRYPSVVVAGSVGKGTTCHHIAHLLSSAGPKVGLYTSPHLHSFRERFSIDGEMISHTEFIEGVKAVRDAIVGEGLRPSPTDTLYSTFEQATALALWWFARRQVDIAVLEVGIGGRWDAVNAAPNALAVFTPIESEHLSMLGGSLQTIAWNKAGIIRREGHAITGGQSAEVLAVLQHEADFKRANLERVDIGFASSPQELAAHLALAAYHNLLDGKVISGVSIPLALGAVTLPGRQEHVQIAGRDVLIDGGHTPLAAHALRAAIDRLARPDLPVRLVVGMLRDKSAADYLSAFDSPRIRLVLTHAPGHRAFTADALANQARLEHASLEVVSDLNSALAQNRTTDEPLFVVAGSLRMAAAAREAFGLLSPDELAEARATRTIFDGDDYLAKMNAGTV